MNLPNDSFVKGSPERSIYLERLIVELYDKLGLHLVDRLIWDVSNKLPGPTQWSFVNRFMLKSGFEFCLCFTNDPSKLRWNNNAVLEEQDPKYLAWCQSGGDKGWSNNTYSKKAGAFSNTKSGKSKIPRNIIKISTQRFHFTNLNNSINWSF